MIRSLKYKTNVMLYSIRINVWMCDVDDGTMKSNCTDVVLYYCVLFYYGLWYNIDICNLKFESDKH